MAENKLTDPRFAEKLNASADVDIPKTTTRKVKRTTKKAVPKGKKATEPKGGTLPVKTPDELEKEAKKKSDLKASRARIDKLNECAKYMLSCLEPGFAADWEQAAEEQRVLDVGVYMLGVLNRLSKMVDYMESDIEPEWEQGLVGYNEHLYCEYCKQEIITGKLTHLKQRFCTNLCAKRYKDANTTGIIYPVNDRHGPDEAAIEEKQLLNEMKGEGVIVSG